MNRTFSFRELRIDIKETLPEEEEETHSNLLMGMKKNSRTRIPADTGYMYHRQKNYKFALKLDFERN